MMNKRFARFSLAALIVLVMSLLIAGIAFADQQLNIPLHNNTAPVGSDCPDDDTAYWHFVVNPNNGSSAFITFYLNLGDQTYTTSVFISNANQWDNVFVAVPSGYTLESLVTAGSSADIVWDESNPQPDDFNLSHVCPGQQAQDLSVTKTAAASYTRTFEWDIDKSADTDTVYSAGGGESGAVNYTIAVTKSDPIDSDFVVSGEITVTNPNNFDVNGVSISDSIPGGTCSVDDTSLDVAANSSASTNYSCTFAENPGSGTNTATAAWTDFGSPHSSDDGTADFAFGDPTTVVNDVIDVTDTNGGSWQFTDSGSVSYSETYTDPAGTCTEHTNTATITQTGEDDSVVVQDCQGADLTVEKTASPSYNLKYAWTIDKAVVGSGSATVDQGQPATFNYTITVTHDAGTESNWKVTGTITVSNPNDWQDVTLSSLDDVTDVGGNCTVDTSAGLTIPMSGSKNYPYECTFASNPDLGTNTATATWDGAAAHTPSDSASDDADFDFGAPTNVIDECITVKDDKATPANAADDVTLGTVCVGDANPKVFTYSLTFTGPAAGTCADKVNTSSFTSNDTGATGSDNATVRLCSYKAALTPGYWKNHLAPAGTTGCTGLPSGTSCGGAPVASTYLPKYIGAYNVNTFQKAAQIWAVMNCSNTGSNSAQNQNSMGCLAGHLLAAKLNVANGANTCIAPVIAKADQFLTNPPLTSVTFGAYTANSVNYIGPSGGYTGISLAQRNLAIALKNALDAYNNGVGCH